jgi:uncharacterized protein (DUF427 family)
MSLTTGRAPLSANPAGRFHPAAPKGAVYVEPFLRRVRAVIGLRTVIDSDRVVLVHRQGQPPVYAFPTDDVHDVASTPEPSVAGYVLVPWKAVTAWFEEEEEVFGGHPRNPYHRVECVRARRRVRVEIASVVLVDTYDTVGVYETSRPAQLYVSRRAVRMDLLVPSRTFTYCAYKGTAFHWSAVIDGKVLPDVAWSYDESTPECAPIAGMLSFYADRVTMTQDLMTWFEVPGRSADESPRVNDYNRSHG